MAYEFKSRVRYSEVSRDKKLSLISLIDYMQDCSIFHSEEVGLGVNEMEAMKRIWMLASWNIEIDRYPDLGEDITVATWPYDCKGFFAYRNFVIYGSGGDSCAKANTVWVLVDLETNHPVRPPAELVAKYGMGPKLDMNISAKKIKLNGEFSKLKEFAVQKHQIDSNGHVNNGQYILMARECLPEDFGVKYLKAEYRNAAVNGDIVIPMLREEGGRYTVRLDSTDGKPFAVVEFE